MGSSARARRHRWRVLVLAALPGALLVTTAANAAPPPAPRSGDAARLSVLPSEMSVVDRQEAPKSPTSRVAETDPELLGRTDATPTPVMIKLDYDSVATYTGSIKGLPATSPSVTGADLAATSAAEQAYDQYIAETEANFTHDLAATVPEATVGNSFRTVYGGVSAVVPANRIGDVAALPGVVAVQQDTLEQLLTDSSPEFIGATSLYPQLGGNTKAGQGVIIGVLDSGAWPEHPSFAQGDLEAPPPRRDGTPRTCDFGDNPLTPAPDVFACNNKLIEGEDFLATYRAVVTDPPEVYPITARDSNGHGTHTASTSAGNVLASAEVLGVPRGPIGGVAPGGHVAVYKVCGALGCFQSDSVAAVAEAIRDGVKVINFSISGGQNPRTDPVELAFLDAYTSGVFVAASAGNSGPGAATTDHLSPWVTTVAASTQTRQFKSALTVTGEDGAAATFIGSTVTQGIATDTPVVFALPDDKNQPDPLCLFQQPAGTYTGVIVACQRGPNRVLKGFTVFNAGAAGMILYNVDRPQTEMTDNHWLPTVHIDEGDELVDFADAHGALTARFTPGDEGAGVGDVMTDFSSRGPGGNFIKPDITAPGLQILAGHTPTPESAVEGPPGQLFQAIAGTSMSSPHIAGSAILLKALHPEWTPGQIKSALMTTATTDVVKEDGETPADPFDFGAGRVDLTKAGNPGLTFDETADNMFNLGTDPLAAVNVNLPSVDVPVLPGRVETIRTAFNVSGRRVRYDVVASAPDGTKIEVSPRRLDLQPAQFGTVRITISSTAEDEVQRFGEIRFVPQGGAGLPTIHVPVAFVPQEGTVTLNSTCTPASIARTSTSTCKVTAQNQSFNPTTVDLSTSVDNHLRIVNATNGATVVGGRAVLTGAALSGAQDGTPAIAPGALFGYVPLDGFSPVVVPLADETLTNIEVPEFTFAGRTYGVVGIDSNGYLVAGGGTAQDNNCCDVALPSPAAPNGILAPYWTDLDGRGATGALVQALTDGTNSWLVVEWRVNVFGTTSPRIFQTWIGIDGTEDITFSYDPATPRPKPAGQDVIVGAENRNGQGASLGLNVVPTTDLRVSSSAPVPGGTATYDVIVRGERVGNGVVTTEMESPSVLGTTIQRSNISVTRR